MYCAGNGKDSAPRPFQYAQARPRPVTPEKLSNLIRRFAFPIC